MSKLFCLPSENGVYSKRKEFAPLGSKFFHFIVDPFSETLCAGQQTGTHKYCLPSYPGPLNDIFHVSESTFSHAEAHWTHEIVCACCLTLFFCHY